MTVHVRITDVSALRFARVFLDGKRIKNTQRKSLTVRIRLSTLHGSHHHLKVVARDASGNTATVTRSFGNCARPHVPNPVFTG
jgi:hypothetical protein